VTENATTRRSLFANSILGVLSWFSPILLGFFTTPVLVVGLGPETYGVYAVILGFLSYSFTFGVGRAAAKYVAEYTASGESRQLSRSLSAVLFFSAAVGIAGALILAALTPWIVRNILLLPESQTGPAETALYIACVTGLMTMISQVFQNTLQGLHRFGTYLLISNFSAVLLGVGNIALAWAGYGIEALIAWNLFSVLTSGTIFFVAAINALPDFRPTLAIGREITETVVKYGASIILYQVFANVFFIFERSWVVRQFGAETLTYYFVPMLLGIYLHGVVLSFVAVLFPRINELLNDRERLTNLYVRSNRLVIALIVLIATSLIVCGEQFLALWVGSEFSRRSWAVLSYHVISFSLIAASVIGWHITESFRAAGINVAITFTWLVVGGSLMLLVGDSNGIEGIAAARLAAIVLTTPVIFYIEKRFLGSVQATHWIGLLARVSAAALAMGGCQWLMTRYLPLGWAYLIAAVSLGMAVYTIVLFLTGFFVKEELERVRSWFSRT
jgi:O-antigen/teichoic acid export membrane protein